jgi:hypothetical protein
VFFDPSGVRQTVRAVLAGRGMFASPAFRSGRG